jgi:hypothetical protein
MENCVCEWKIGIQKRSALKNYLKVSYWIEVIVAIRLNDARGLLVHKAAEATSSPWTPFRFCRASGSHLDTRLCSGYDDKYKQGQL